MSHETLSVRAARNAVRSYRTKRCPYIARNGVRSHRTERCPFHVSKFFWMLDLIESMQGIYGSHAYLKIASITLAQKLQTRKP